MNIAVATFYRSGILALQQLLNLGVDRDDIRVFTYDRERNEEVIDFLESENLEYTTDPIGSEEGTAWLEAFDPDVLFSLYYRDKIPAEVLDTCRYGGVNLHPSLLPKYGGVLSVPWAMVEGESKTGYTYHYMTDEIDAGPIIFQREVEITDRDTAYSLYHRIIHAGMQDFLPALELVLDGYGGYPQEGEGSYHGRGDLPNDGVIDHSWDDDRIERFIRAMHYPPFPPAVARFDGDEYEITSMAVYRQLRERYAVSEAPTVE
ncbi:MAG: methionyl-tRNA formyltransferase [Salinigranum sp.]